MMKAKDGRVVSHLLDIVLNALLRQLSFHIKSLMALPNTRAWTFNEGHVVVHSELQRCY